MGCGGSKDTQTSSQSQPKAQTKEEDKTAASAPGEFDGESPGHSKLNLVVVVDEVPGGSAKGSTSDLVKCSADEFGELAASSGPHHNADETMPENNHHSTNIDSDSTTEPTKPVSPVEEATENPEDSVKPKASDKEMKTTTKPDGDAVQLATANSSVYVGDEAEPAYENTNNTDDNINSHSEEAEECTQPEEKKETVAEEKAPEEKAPEEKAPEEPSKETASEEPKAEEQTAQEEKPATAEGEEAAAAE